MKTLVELLCRLPAKDLFLMIQSKNLPLPDPWTEEEIQELRRVYRSPTDNDHYYLQVLEDWENGEYDTSDEEEPEDEEDSKVREFQKQWMEQSLAMGRKLRAIEAAREQYAAVLAEELLKPENIRNLLLQLSTPVIQTLREICSGEIAPEADFYPIHCSPDKRRVFDILEDKGYALIQKTDPYDEEDDREHYTGLALSDDVLAVIRKEHTPELEARRSLWDLLHSLTIIVQDYYDLAPMQTVLHLYEILRSDAPDRYPELTESELEQALEEYCKASPFEIFGILPFRGTRYLCNITGEDAPTDDTSPEDSFLVAQMENWSDRDIDPYIPTLEEMKNFRQYGYWEAKKPFRDLREFIREYYLDEQYIEDRCGMIMLSAMGPEEMEEYARKRHYSLEMVEENTGEMFSELCADISGGNEPGDIYKWHKDFTRALNDSAKRKFRRLLGKCTDCVPLSWMLGHTRQETQ